MKEMRFLLLIKFIYQYIESLKYHERSFEYLTFQSK